ncbi:MAG TPA: endonuclease/exonuclease/phosphatase family protein, partial [Ardenticatenaceae bacterium]|nr:endonuclease/exonuclease/phosphatase family protein [Ardenticatenaceae bacterium]
MRSLASLLALAYALLVALWFGAFLFAGERTWWLVLLPAVIPWLFMLSFPFALALALLGRWNVGRWALLAVALLAAWLWGGLFLPPSPVPRAAASGAQLRVMTLNALVENAQHDRLVAAIASAGADIVAIQELSPGQATAISTRLGETYPYHALHPWGDPRGIGLWSRYPVTEIATYDEGDWENWLQHVVVEMAGRRIHIFNLHAWPVALDQPRQIMMSAALHQKQTEQLATTLARSPPVEP